MFKSLRSIAISLARLVELLELALIEQGKLPESTPKPSNIPSTEPWTINLPWVRGKVQNYGQDPRPYVDSTGPAKVHTISDEQLWQKEQQQKQ